MSPLSHSSVRNARWGLVLFAVYFVFYGTFIAVNAFAPDWMGQSGWGGVNIAIWTGLGLIALAFGLAVVYLYHATDDQHEAPGVQS